jgi:hypothetical protein
MKSASLANEAKVGTLEEILNKHFDEKYFSLLLLRDCHPDYSRRWLADIKQRMEEHDSLRYAVLANAASHLHFVDASSWMQVVALTFYSSAISSLSRLLATCSVDEKDDGFLMSVMMLYLHGVSFRISAMPSNV